LIDEEDDWNLVLYSPLMVIGYKHLVDLIIIKGVLDVAFKRKNLGWTSAKHVQAASKTKVTTYKKEGSLGFDRR
jgi:hypothetical protein